MLGQDDGRQSLADGPVYVHVFGRARTKGSMEPVHKKTGPGKCRVWLTEDNPHSKPWKEHMMREIVGVCRVERFPGAVRVDCEFTFERLASEERRGALWPIQPPGPTAQGDLDKLVRNVYDALTQSGLIKDDCLVVGGYALKRFAQPGEAAGVRIAVSPA